MPSDIEVPQERPDYREAYAAIRQILGIPASEPVYILRGQDETFSKTVRFDARAKAASGNVSAAFITQIENIANNGEYWPKKKGADHDAAKPVHDADASDTGPYSPTTHAWPTSVTRRY